MVLISNADWLTRDENWIIVEAQLQSDFCLGFNETKKNLINPLPPPPLSLALPRLYCSGYQTMHGLYGKCSLPTESRNPRSMFARLFRMSSSTIIKKSPPPLDVSLQNYRYETSDFWRKSLINFFCCNYIRNAMPVKRCYYLKYM